MTISANFWTAAAVSTVIAASYNPATAAVEVVVKPDNLSYRTSQNTRGIAANPKPLLSDIKRIYDEEILDDAQAAALEAMHKASETNPLPRGKRIPRR